MKYDELDTAIVKAIEHGARKFADIHAAVRELALPHSLGQRGTDRVVDRRLQALRKQRKITYWAGRWSVL